MLSQTSILFYEKWTNNLDETQTGGTEAVFNRFIYQLIAFNFLYRKVSPLSSNVRDRQAAVKEVYEFFGKKGCTQFVQQIDPSDLREIIRIIREKEFYISFDIKGRYQRRQDRAILEKLDSKDSSEKCEGILTVIYKVRCNLFHGNKLFDPRQSRLLEPLNRILKVLNAHLYQKLLYSGINYDQAYF